MNLNSTFQPNPYINGRKCCVESCENTGRNCNLTFFMVPRDNPVKAEKWLSVLKLKPNPPQKKFICSDHFEMKCFTSTLRRRLVCNAFPTLQKKLPEEKGITLERSMESHFVWNSMPNSKNSKSSQASSEEMCVIASLYLASDDEKSNERNVEITEKPEFNGTVYKVLPVLNDEKFVENKDKFIQETINDYFKKRYVSDNQEENRKFLTDRINQLKSSNPIKKKRVKKEGKKYRHLKRQFTRQKITPLSKLPCDSNSDDRKRNMQSKKLIKMCNLQNYMPSISDIQAEKITKICKPQSDVPLTSTKQPEKVINICNPQNHVPSTSTVQSKKVKTICNSQNCGPLTSTLQPEKVTKICNPQNCLSSVSTIQTEKVTKICNLQNCVPSIPTIQAGKVTKTCNMQNSVPLTSITDIKSFSVESDHTHTQPEISNSLPESQMPRTPESGQIEAETMCMVENGDDCDKIAASIADELKKLKNLHCRAKAILSIQKVLSEIRSGDYDM